MPNYTITDGNDDFYTNQPDGGGISYYYTTTTLYFGENNVISPGVVIVAYTDIDTDDIPDNDEISEAILYFYFDSYTASRGISKTYKVWMLSADESTWTLIDSGTFVSAGWYSVTLTADERAEIDKVDKTKFRFTTDDPGAGKARTAQLRAYEYDVGHTYPAYLAVTHAAPGVGTPKKISLAPQVIRFDSDTNKLIRL